MVLAQATWIWRALAAAAIDVRRSQISYGSDWIALTSAPHSLCCLHESLAVSTTTKLVSSSVDCFEHEASEVVIVVPSYS